MGLFTFTSRRQRRDVCVVVLSRGRRLASILLEQGQMTSVEYVSNAASNVRVAETYQGAEVAGLEHVVAVARDQLGHLDHIRQSIEEQLAVRRGSNTGSRLDGSQDVLLLRADGN